MDFTASIPAFGYIAIALPLLVCLIWFIAGVRQAKTRVQEDDPDIPD